MQEQIWVSGEEYTEDPQLSLVETNTNVLTKAETKPQTTPSYSTWLWVSWSDRAINMNSLKVLW